MIIFKKAVTLQKHIEKRKAMGESIGFVPTMGALHQGHLSLIKKSKSQCDTTVSSIFVNPTQFNDPKDFEKYPVTINNDVLLLENEGCDMLFLPSVEEMYPNGFNSSTYYDLGEIENLLEGKYRPGHFQGVCQAVERLLNIVHPDVIFTGQKDYQQYLVLEKLVTLTNRNVIVVKVDTYREVSGLAMSSRNLRLNHDQKINAAAISEMLTYIKNNIATLSFAELQKHAADSLLKNGFSKIDYVAIVNANTLKPVEDVSVNEPLIALIAACIGDIRLIDNVILTE